MNVWVVVVLRRTVRIKLILAKETRIPQMRENTLLQAMLTGEASTPATGFPFPRCFTASRVT